MNLYSFEKLAKRLDDWGFPAVSREGHFQVIKGVDFKKALQAGKIDFTDEGIYLKYHDKSYQGYMFIKYYYVNKYGYPKFHLLRCKTIDEFIQKGQFNQRYEWSNSKVNDIIDGNTGTVYPNVTLELCRNCASLLNADYHTTEGFFNKLDKSNISYDKKVEVDIFGYVKNWERFSRNFRKEKEFKCDVCGLQPTNRREQRYWHVHHKDGNKLNNDLENLQCLCIRCHSQVDETHKQNFSQPLQAKELAAFNERYAPNKI
ncbi:hypothetical protein A6A19_06470 [Actinobacillus delphinicola]|uniref:HNH endonuclease signature motif containing protein n=1 Tax=Actinobacillus delphinicola TaxID=51161 RepID=UPI0024435156|nr:HNH endonuclease [Actinobacillus delphinicola]MDG6897633.1 hypothetical protein [Actinobacillus delphinicola]